MYLIACFAAAAATAASALLLIWKSNNFDISIFKEHFPVEPPEQKILYILKMRGSKTRQEKVFLYLFILFNIPVPLFFPTV